MKPRISQLIDLTRPIQDEYHVMALPQLREALSTDLNDGLGYTSLRRAQQRYGANEFVKPKTQSLLTVFFGNCVGGIQTGLWIATFALFFANLYPIWDCWKLPSQWFYLHAIRVPYAYSLIPIVTCCIIIVNSIILTCLPFHQSKAAKKLQTRKFRPVMVYREGHSQQIDARSLLPGDIVTDLRCPDSKSNLIVPADMRILENSSDIYVSLEPLTGKTVRTIYEPRN